MSETESDTQWHNRLHQVVAVDKPWEYLNAQCYLDGVDGTAMAKVANLLQVLG
jgi:hypothetical protein